MASLFAWIKRLPSTDLGTTLMVDLGFMLIGFIVVYFCHTTTYYGYVGVLLFTLYLIGTHYIDQYANKTKLTGRILGPLQDIGFKIEHIKDYDAIGSDYWGLLGTYRGYPIRIRYDRSGGRKGASEIYFTLYFGHTDSDEINRIIDNKKRWWQYLGSTYDYMVTEIDSVIRSDRFLYIWTYAGVIERLDAMVDIVSEANLSQIDEKDIPALPQA